MLRPPLDPTKYRLRRAGPADAVGMTAAHHASIQGLGPAFYAAELRDMMAFPRWPPQYIQAMAKGEVFFLVEPLQVLLIKSELDEAQDVPYFLGVSSHWLNHRQGQHHLRMMCMRPQAKGEGIVWALYQAVVDYALTLDASRFYIDGNLCGLTFHKGQQVIQESSARKQPSAPRRIKQQVVFGPAPDA